MVKTIFSIGPGHRSTLARLRGGRIRAENSCRLPKRPQEITATLVIRSLSTGDLHARDWWRVALKELAVGFLLAIALTALIAIRGIFQGPELALVLGTSLAAVILWANLIGAILPIAVRALKLDPAVVSAPLITTIVDVTGLVIYFSIARWMLA